MSEVTYHSVLQLAQQLSEREQLSLISQLADRMQIRKAFQAVLQKLLDDLDKINESHGEVDDIAVREDLRDAITITFIEGNLQYPLPESFNMFSEEADKLVRQSLIRFLNHPDVLSAIHNTKNPYDRFNMFQDESVLSSSGSQYIDYFGHIDNM